MRKAERDVPAGADIMGWQEADAGVRVQIRNLAKTFPGTRALNDVDVDIRAGEIHALVGGNGSGKSTLIKILTGVHQADPGGMVLVEGAKIDLSHITPEKARAAKIYAVHQDLGVFADLSVAENLALGYRYERGFAGRIRWRRQRERARRLMESFDIDAAPDTELRMLSQATWTLVAIARAMQTEEGGNDGLLILDEPTASLPLHEVDLLLSSLRGYAAEGQAILYVSHRLDEILALSDRVTVLRDGSKVGTYPTSELDEESLIALIVGRAVDRAFPSTRTVHGGDPIVEVRGLSAGPLNDINLVLRPGEVVGLGGLEGSGRTELLRAIFGDLQVDAGEILLNGQPAEITSPAAAIEQGIALIPERRVTDACFPDQTVCENMSATNTSDYWIGGRMANRRMRADARALMRNFLVKAPTERQPMATLSGGNQQKVILARWLRREPRALLLDEPTHGVDVGARAEIYALIRDAVAQGAGAIVVASDFEELAQVCDRVAILREGRIVGELSSGNITAEALTQAAFQRNGNVAIN